jgi:hypothetical protein
VDRVTFVLHPGYVESKNDHQRHFIGVAQLRELYRLDRFPSKRVVVYNYRDERTTLGFHDQPEYVHLYPHGSGRYELPDNCPRPP